MQDLKAGNNKISVTELESGEYIVEVFGPARECYDDEYCDNFIDAESVACSLQKEIEEEEHNQVEH